LLARGQVRIHQLRELALKVIRVKRTVTGRVSAFNMLFIGTSSELGAFESGFVAAFIGVVPCAVAGGVGVLLTAAVWARLFPSLRQVEQMPSVPPRRVSG
jgi:hypothetical protein